MIIKSPIRENPAATDDYRTGTQLLDAFKCKTREEKLEVACKALMATLNELHIKHESQSLAENINNTSIFCSCADAYRMGDEALKM